MNKLVLVKEDNTAIPFRNFPELIDYVLDNEIKEYYVCKYDENLTHQIAIGCNGFKSKGM